MTLYSVKLSSRALSDLSDCVLFVMNVSVEAAKKLRDDLFSTALILESFPEMNPVFEMPKTFPLTIRKCVVEKRYIILYSIENTDVVIQRVLDSRRNFNYLV